MKKIGIFCLILLFLLTPVEVFAADASVSDGCNTLDAQWPVLGREKLVDNTAAAVLYETSTDTLMYADNADAKMSPASLVKILTALIAIEKGNLNDVATVRAEVLSSLSPNAAVVDLVIGEVLTVKDLLYCMMVASGNDAAAVLADRIMGSQQAFVDEMNRYAVALGCRDTVFTNVHGLNDDRQYTTARDMARILSKAVENQTFCDIFGAKTYVVQKTNKSEERRLVSQNYLLNDDGIAVYYDSRVTGSRTAVADDRTRSLASVANIDGMNLICIVMGSESVYDTDGYSVKVYGGYDETRTLLDLGFTGYKAVQLLHPGQILLQRSVAGSDYDVAIGTQTGVFSVVPSNFKGEDLSYKFVEEAQLQMPIQEGQYLATVQVWCGSLCIAQTELFAMNSVVATENIPILEPVTPQKNNTGKIVLYVVGIAVILALLCYIGLSVVRAVKIAKARNQSRRHSRNRRRSR